MFTGDVYLQETYISVDWPWVILPIAETLFAVVLLGVSIVLTSGQPLLKTSLIAFLAYGFRDGWKKKDVGISGPEDSAILKYFARNTSARLVEDGDGELHFERM